METASDRWTIVSTPATNIISLYHKLLNNIVPRNLMPGSNSFGTKNLPYAYFTVKHKCFKACHQLRAGITIPPAPDAMPTPPHNHIHEAHTCGKEGHSCLRNIVSFKKLPGRNTFRRMGRAFMHGVRSVAQGYGLKNLSKGRDDILIALEKQFSRHVVSGRYPGCVQCGACMAGPTLHTADAGQAYEMIRPSKIEDSFSRIFKAIRATTNQNDPTLSVIHSVKSKAKYGGWITEKLYDRSVFFLSKVAHGMRTLAKLRYYKFGNSFLYQCSGIPIGGPVSGAILESVLCMEEHRFDRFRWPQVAARTKLRGKREKWITFLRYVDDVFGY